MTLMYLPARISKLLSGMREFKKEKLFADYQIILPACCYDAHSTGARKCKYFVQGPRYLWRSFSYIPGQYYVFLRDIF